MTPENNTQPQSVSLSGAVAPQAAALFSSSLDPLETSPTNLPDQTRPQLQIHAQHAPARFAMWDAFRTADAPALHKRAIRLERCCQLPTIRVTEDGQPIVAPQRCRDRLCPLCSGRKAKEAGERMTEAAKRMDAARMMTLTAPHLDSPLRDQLASLRAAFAALRRSEPWRRHVTGGLYAIEITFNPPTGQYHPHLHVLCDGDYWDWKGLREAWRLALNHRLSPWSVGPDDPLVTRIEAIRDRRRAAAYVTKYICKPTDLDRWPAHAVQELALALVGSRLLHTFGSLHGANLDPSDPNEPQHTTTHVAGLHWLNAAARAGQETAQQALVLFRCLFPAMASWTRRDLSAVPDGVLAPSESIQGAFIRLASAAEAQWWSSMERMHTGQPPNVNPPPVRVRARQLALSEYTP